MKKLIYVLVFALCLSGCGKEAGTQSNSKGQQLTAGDKSSLIKASVSIDEGRYVKGYTTNRQMFAYIDYASAAEVPLCNQPSCPHNAEGCAALLAEGDYSNALYNMGNDILAASTYGGKADSPPKIIIMSKDGSNRKELYIGKSGERIDEILASDAENLYFVLANDIDTSQSGVYSIPLTGGEPVKKISLEATYGSQVLGTSGRDMYFYCYDWSAANGLERPMVPEGATQEEIDKIFDEYDSAIIGKHWVEATSVDTGESKKLLEWTSQQGSTGKALFMKNQTLYWVDEENLSKINPDGTQEQTKVNWQLDASKKEAPTSIEVVSDTFALVRVLRRERDDVKDFRYKVDLVTGEVSAIDLNFMPNGREKPIAICGVSTHGLLVQYDCRMESVVNIMPDGTAFDDNKVTNSYAMITYDDFFASKPNYKEIKTQFTADLYGY